MHLKTYDVPFRDVCGEKWNPKFIDSFLDVLEPLLSDRSRYVRDNLGPFAIGGTLIKCYPTQVLKRLDTWINDQDEQVRWNIAMIFSAAEGAKFAHESKHVLDILLSDERPYVKRAVSKAIKNIEPFAELSPTLSDTLYIAYRMN